MTASSQLVTGWQLISNVTNHRWSITNGQPSVASHQWSAISGQSFSNIQHLLYSSWMLVYHTRLSLVGEHSIDLYCFIWLLDAYIIHHPPFSVSRFSVKVSKLKSYQVYLNLMKIKYTHGDNRCVCFLADKSRIRCFFSSNFSCFSLFNQYLSKTSNTNLFNTVP